jgi:glycerol uptake facilitator-like aquaporin
MYSRTKITKKTTGRMIFSRSLARISNSYSPDQELLSEFVAAFGLMSVIWGCSWLRADATPFAVASYIVAAYWFTASTSFANPAVTIARCLSDTFAGIRPADVPGFIVAQLAGALAATFLFRWLVPEELLPRPDATCADGNILG